MMTAEAIKDLDKFGFECAADAYPHVAYQADQERFWQYFHKRCPELTRDEMKRILEETDE